MRVLIIEDLQLKIDEMTKFLLELDPSISIEIRTSYHAGLQVVLDSNDKYDLILLDMSMQNYNITQNEYGGDPINLAGYLLLDQMYNNEIENKVIVVTMYPYFGDGRVSLNDLHSRLLKEFPSIYLGHVFFSPPDTKWKDSLSKIINENFQLS
jgi:CheY-like chemotaxis protein